MSETINIDDLPDEIQSIARAVNQSLEPMPPQDAINRFLEVKSSEIRPQTLGEYENKLEHLLHFCEMRDIENLNNFTGRNIDGFRRWRKHETADQSEPLSNKTMRDDMYLLRDFLSFLEDIEAVRNGLSNKVDVPSLDDDDGVRTIELDPERLAEILDYLRTYQYASREHVVWEFHADNGRRPGDLFSLDLCDLHLDCDDPYIELNHRPDETGLKNGNKSENEIALSEKVAQIFKHYIESNRIDSSTDPDREPFLTSRYGRLSKSTMRRYVYRWSRPCEIGASCPHDRDVDECTAAGSNDKASKCPSSRPPYALRHGYITQMRREGIPKEIVGGRCDVSPEVIEKHWSRLRTV